MDHPRWSHLPKDSILKRYPSLITNIELLNALARMEESCRIVVATLRRDAAEQCRDQNTDDNRNDEKSNNIVNDETNVLKTEYWNIFLVSLATIVMSMEAYRLFNKIIAEYKVFSKKRISSDSHDSSDSANVSLCDENWRLTLQQWLNVKSHVYFLQHNSDLLPNNPEYQSLLQEMPTMDRLTLICSLKYCMIQLETVLDKLLKFLKQITVNCSCLTEGTEKLYLDDTEFVIKILRNFSHNMDQDTMIILTG